MQINYNVKTKNYYVGPATRFDITFDAEALPDAFKVTDNGWQRPFEVRSAMKLAELLGFEPEFALTVLSKVKASAGQHTDIEAQVFTAAEIFRRRKYKEKQEVLQVLRAVLPNEFYVSDDFKVAWPDEEDYL